MTSLRMPLTRHETSRDREAKERIKMVAHNDTCASSLWQQYLETGKIPSHNHFFETSCTSHMSTPLQQLQGLLSGNGQRQETAETKAEAYYDKCFKANVTKHNEECSKIYAKKLSSEEEKKLISEECDKYRQTQDALREAFHSGKLKAEE